MSRNLPQSAGELKEVQETHGAELASHKQKARKLLEENDAQI